MSPRVFFSLAALVVIGSVMWAEPTAAQRAVEQQRAASGPRDGLRVSQPGATIQRATTSISCNNANGTVTTFTLSVRGGTCLTDGAHGSGGTAGIATCVGDGTDEAEATCGRGCTKTAGEGSCTQTTN